MSFPRKLNLLVDDVQQEEEWTKNFHHVFWLGDLNFRIRKQEGEIDQVLKTIETIESDSAPVKNYEQLFVLDELFLAQKESITLHNTNTTN